MVIIDDGGNRVFINDFEYCYDNEEEGIEIITRNGTLRSEMSFNDFVDGWAGKK